MSTQRKVIVTHSANRDYYQVAKSFSEAGLLRFLVTDDFFLRKTRGFLPSEVVRISWLSLFLQLFHCFIITKPWVNKLKDALLSWYSFQISRKYPNDILLCYGGYTRFPFSLKSPKVLFQFYPHFSLVKTIFLSELNNSLLENIPTANNSLQNEQEFFFSEIDKARDEINKSTLVICSSTFSAQTLLFAGLDKKKILIIPYGIDTSIFYPKKKYSRHNGQISIIYAGNFSVRKGLYYLLEAVHKLQIDGYNIFLTLCGRGYIDRHILSNMKNITIKHNLIQKELLKEYHNADVFVFPSLADGFGHVVLEAMASGLPVIATTNSCGPDVITDGIDGFIIPIQSVEAIKEKIMLLYNNPNLNEQMSKNAFQKAQNYTWKRFREKISETIQYLS